MAKLTDTEKEMLSSNGGFPVGGNWGRIRFLKKEKPNRTVKRFLRGKGYQITNDSGRGCNPYMDYELIENDNELSGS